MARHQNLALALLLAVYVTNQWSRYSIVYLQGTAPACTRAGAVCDVLPASQVPVCASSTCTTPGCEACKACFAEHDMAWRNLRYGACVDSSEFGVLVSYGYMAAFCVMGLVAGRMADLYARRRIIVAACVVWGAFTVLQAAAGSFEVLLVARIGMGLSHAMSGPASLSMIADLFSPEERSSANGIYTFGIYVGGGLSSLSLLAANQLGWRASSAAIAAMSIAPAIALALLVPEPRPHAYEDSPNATAPLLSSSTAQQEQEQDHQEQQEHEQQEQQGQQGQEQQRGNYQSVAQEDGGDGAETEQVSEAKKTMALGEVLRIVAADKVILLLFLAAPTRFLGGFAIGNFMPQYFARRYPESSDLYSTLNALIVSLGGATSAYAGGRLTDAWRRRNKRAPALVPALASLLALVPTMGILYSSSFEASIAFLLLEYLVAECWFGPAISIMQERVPGAARGLTISIYLFISGIVGSLAPALLGQLDDGSGWETLRGYLALFVGISYAGTFVFFGIISLIL